MSSAYHLSKTPSIHYQSKYFNLKQSANFLFLICRKFSIDEILRSSYNIIYANQYADMAELADAHGSGPCEGYFMEVRVLLSAPI